MERNASAATAAAISTSGSVAKDDDRYSPHRSIAGMRSIEAKGVALSASKDSTRRSIPRKGTLYTLKITGTPLQVGVREPNSADIGPGATEIRSYSHTDRHKARLLSFVCMDQGRGVA